MEKTEKMDRMVHTKKNPCRLLLSSDNKLYAACYSYDPTSQLRTGSIEIFDTLLQNVGGVFDLPYGILSLSACGSDKLITGNSDGTLRVMDIEGKEIAGVSVSSKALIMHHDYSEQSSRAFCALSDGRMAIVDLGSPTGEFLGEFKAHDYEVWSVHQPSFHPKLVLTGSDDCQIKFWDIDTHKNLGNTTKQNAGICMIKPGLHSESEVISACYDGSLKVWDLRNIGTCLHSWKAGEQCWDFAFVKIAENIFHFTTVNIYSGARRYIIDSAYQISSTLSLVGNESIVYGVALPPDASVDFACSFYDNMICRWKV